jgi:hypothetical protein
MDVQQFEQAILKLAFETNTRLTAASVAYYMGMPTRETSRLLNMLLEEGVLELDSDPEGNLFYRVPHQSEIASVLHAPAPSPEREDEGAAALRTDIQIVEDALAREDARLVSLDEVSDVEMPMAAFSPRRWRPNGEAEGFISAPSREPAALARAPRQVIAVEESDAVSHAVVGRRPARRGVVLEGVLASATDGTPGMGYGRRGGGSPLVQAGARCEHKPLPEARTVIASCATTQDEPRSGRLAAGRRDGAGRRWPHARDHGSDRSARASARHGAPVEPHPVRHRPDLQWRGEQGHHDDGPVLPALVRAAGLGRPHLVHRGRGGRGRADQPAPAGAELGRSAQALSCDARGGACGRLLAFLRRSLVSCASCALVLRGTPRAACRGRVSLKRR